MYFFFFSSRRRHTRLQGDWSSDVCSSDLRRQQNGVKRLYERGHVRTLSRQPVKPGHELLRAERLGQVIVDPEFERPRDVRLTTARRYDDDLGLATLHRAQGGEDVEARHLRHHQIEQGKVRLPGPNGFERLQSVEYQKRLIAGRAQLRVEDAHDVWIVFRDQYRGLGWRDVSR